MLYQKGSLIVTSPTPFGVGLVISKMPLVQTINVPLDILGKIRYHVCGYEKEWHGMLLIALHRMGF